MNAITRSPHRGWELLGGFDEIVNGLFAPIRHAPSTESALMPAVDIRETSAGYEVSVDLPGIKRENLSVSVKQELLTIEAGSSIEDAEKEGQSMIKLERRAGKYLRTLRLGNAIDKTKISAQYTDGVLKLILPKAEKAVSRKIDIAVH